MAEPVHFRRCHVCGMLSEQTDGKVEKCQGCGKSLAPFFYFDDVMTAVVGDSTLRPALIENEYSPILGLTVYWESF